MSVPHVDLLNSGWNLIPLAVAGASLTGSVHCVSMCGGLVVAVARSRTETLAYHAGRLLGYTLLGAIGGALGAQVLSSANEGITTWLSWVAALAVGASLILIGIRTWRGNNPHLFHLPSPALNFLYRHAGKNAFLTGALSAFLPCGWLQNFVLAAIATRSATAGAMLLFFFWLGTLPALTLTPMLVQKLLQPLARKLPRLSAILLISAGVFSVGLKAASLTRHEDGSAHSCHSTASQPVAVAHEHSMPDHSAHAHHP